MDQRLRHIERERGVFTRQEARDCGYDDKAVAAALRHGGWHRVRHGAYCFAATWSALGPDGRHLILARAVMRSMACRVALSHTSSLLAQGCAVWGADLSRVHVTRLDKGAGRIEADVHHHLGRCREGDLVERDGLLLTEPARAVLESATLGSVESGLVSADSALHLSLTESDRLHHVLTLLDHWRGSRKVQLVVRMADSRAESVGESRSRFLFWSQGLPAPVLQFRVSDANGILLGISDFAWPEHGLLGEFDGRVKYGRLVRPGEEPGDVVFREKRREDLMREITTWPMGRLIWRDLGAPAATGHRFRRLLGTAA